MTSTGSTIGTWAYMAPERFESGTADARADIYALACVLYQALTGRPPFPGDPLAQVAGAHMIHPPPRPSELWASVSGNGERKVAKSAVDSAGTIFVADQNASRVMKLPQH